MNAAGSSGATPSPTAARAARGLAAVLAVASSLAGGGPGALAQPAAIPIFDIWAVSLGEPLEQMPFNKIAFAACGTNGGPPAMVLDRLEDFRRCPAERSGLREVYFEYDDEQAYIARALRLEWEVLLAGTTMYGHPIIPSVLVDDGGVVRGIRVVTDNRIKFVPEGLTADDIRGAAYLLAFNLKQRFAHWNLNCEQLPAEDGQTPVGNKFVHEVCRAESPSGDQKLVIDAHYYRRRGEVGIDVHNLQLVSGAFESATRFELVQGPYVPTTVHDAR